MQFKPEEWIDLYHSVGVGGGGSLGIRISMAGSLVHPAITQKYEWGARGEDKTPADVNELLSKAGMSARELEDDIRRINTVRDPIRIDERASTRARILLAFPERHIYVEEIPNEYSKQYYTAMEPWFIVTTSRGRIKVGWRRRVINIDWSDSEVKASGMALFPDEETTRGEGYGDGGCYVHAWSYEKLAEYLKVILAAP